MEKNLFFSFKMSALAEWQSFARSTNLKGWSRLKKDELKDFLMENLWKEGSGKPKMKKRNPLMKKNRKINAPFLIPEKRKILSKNVPRAIKENIMHVVDWADWLESVEDEEIRKKSTPAVEKLKKQIAELWGEKLVVEKGKSAFGKFARQFIIRGDDSLSLQEFFRKVFFSFKMSALAEWQSFARSTNLKGWSRLKKDELKDFCGKRQIRFWKIRKTIHHSRG